MLTLTRGLIAAGLQAISISLDIIADNIDPPTDADQELEELRGAVAYYQDRIVKQKSGLVVPDSPNGTYPIPEEWHASTGQSAHAPIVAGGPGIPRLAPGEEPGGYYREDESALSDEQLAKWFGR
jgi:hypothetical protein